MAIPQGCEHRKWVDNGTAFLARGRIRCLACGAILDYCELDAGVVLVYCTGQPWPACWPGNQPLFKS
jgi:hypothetical protein